MYENILLQNLVFNIKGGTQTEGEECHLLG
jgi:hypothetical protein